MIKIAENVSNQLKELNINEIRIVLKGVGCSGPAFELVAGKAEENEQTIVIDGLSFSIDPIHEKLFRSMEIKFAEGAKKGFFISISSETTGGCGSCCGCQETDRLNQPYIPQSL